MGTDISPILHSLHLNTTEKHRGTNWLEDPQRPNFDWNFHQRSTRLKKTGKKTGLD